MSERAGSLMNIFGGAGSGGSGGGGNDRELTERSVRAYATRSTSGTNLHGLAPSASTTSITDLMRSRSVSFGEDRKSEGVFDDKKKQPHDKDPPL